MLLADILMNLRWRANAKDSKSNNSEFALLGILSKNGESA